MSKRAKTKRQIYARRYVFSVGDEHHQIEADDVRDLVRQVTDLVPGTQRLSRWLNWPGLRVNRPTSRPHRGPVPSGLCRSDCV